MNSQPRAIPLGRLLIATGTIIALVLTITPSRPLSVKDRAACRSAPRSASTIQATGTRSPDIRIPQDPIPLSGDASTDAASPGPGQYKSLEAAIAAARYAVEKIDPAVPHSRGADYFAANPAQQMRAWFSHDGVELASGMQPTAGAEPWSVSIRLRGITRDAAEAPVSLGTSSAQGGRVEMHYPDLAASQWFENRKDGIEQGFTLQQRPAGDAAEVKLMLGVEGSLRAEAMGAREGARFIDATGGEIVHYTRLKAWDADGKTLAARMEVRGGDSISLVVNDHGANYPVTVDPLFVNAESRLILTQQGVNGEAFGKCVSISGDRVLVGEPMGDTSSGYNAGTAFIFVRNGDNWTQEALLNGGNFGYAFQAFGTSVSISGDTALVGTPYDDGNGSQSGAAYVFFRDNTGWHYQNRLLAGDRSTKNYFGAAVAISGDYAVVGSPADKYVSGPEYYIGAAYFFSRNGTTWTQQGGKKTPLNGIKGDCFGWSVALSGDTALIGSPGGYDGRALGSAHVYTRSGNDWSLQKKIVQPNGEIGDCFGWSVALSGDTALVGAPSIDFNIVPPRTIPSFAPGSAYAFFRTGTEWNSQGRLNASDGVTGDVFGCSVAVSDTLAVVGSPYSTSQSSRGGGLAYIFEKNGNVWNEQKAVSAGIDASDQDQFGEAVALSGNYLVVGASRDQTVGTNVGSAYTFLLGRVPEITQQPQSRTVVPGVPVIFSVVATGHGPLSYRWRKNGSQIAGANQPSYTIPSAQVADQGSYDVVVSNTGGITTSAAAVLSVNALSEFARSSPVAPLDAQGVVVVTLSPPGIAGGWRFTGELGWRPSGVPVTGLVTSDRIVEFMPVNGYIHPSPEPVGITSGAAELVTGSYLSTGNTGSGGITVTLKPDSLASQADESQRGQWRLYKLGANTSPWLNSGAGIVGLLPASYLIECKFVPGRATPPLANVTVEDGDPSLATVTYFLADSQTGVAPVVLPFETVSANSNLPYAYVGQIRSDVGSGSGFVVKPRVVLTAGHVIFDDGTLSVVTGLQWLFQRDTISHEPVPLVPRGIHLVDDYAAARSAPGVVPGVGTTESQNRDAAALHFAADAGRGGYGGFLASDATDNEFLLSSAQKTLVGYPVDDISAANRGRMHATPAMNVHFTRVPTLDEFGTPFRTYTTSDVRGSRGMSGGPLCVQFEGGNYYPAAIHLGGSNQTVVRAIDSKVIDVITRAQAASAAGDNQTGGGYTLSSFSTISGGSSLSGQVKVIIKPDAARDAGALWRVNERDYHSSGVTDTLPAPGPTESYKLYLTPVTGFQTPDSAGQTLVFKGGKIQTVTYTYIDENDPPTISNIGNRTIDEDTAAVAIPITLADPDDPENALDLTGSSSDATLVPDANIVFGGSGSARTVTVTPSANRSGSTTITLTVSDGKLTAIETFLLTVNPVNDPPTLSAIPDQTIPANNATAALNFTLGDVDIATVFTLQKTSSNTTLVPHANIVFGGSGTARTVTITPAAGQLGTAAIILTVSDGTLNASRTFFLTVTGTPRENWRFAAFGTASATGSAADTADPDGDGCTNGDEYAAGTDPNNPTDVFKVLSVTKSAGACTLTVPGKVARTYILERRATLASGPWTTVTSAGPLAIDTTVTLTDSSPLGNSGFYRIRVSVP
ncbi:MAG: immunoglobulin domain-containing protein [Luteolibacter sp.]|uniref:immunoglobulin domain-containing protein n=1 Tax=Luteolibacter sp. TaxID=1962973 RepID=UPI0032644EE5